MLSARLEQPSHRDLGIEHCRERTTMRWDCVRQDGTDYRNFQGLAKWHQHLALKTEKSSREHKLLMSLFPGRSFTDVTVARKRHYGSRKQNFDHFSMPTLWVFPIIKSFFPINQTSSPWTTTLQAQHKASNFAREAEMEMTTLSVTLAGKEKGLYVWVLSVKGSKEKTCNPRWIGTWWYFIGVSCFCLPCYLLK